MHRREPISSLLATSSPRHGQHWMHLFERYCSTWTAGQLVGWNDRELCGRGQTGDGRRRGARDRRAACALPPILNQPTYREISEHISKLSSHYIESESTKGRTSGASPDPTGINDTFIRQNLLLLLPLRFRLSFAHDVFRVITYVWLINCDKPCSEARSNWNVLESFQPVFFFCSRNQNYPNQSLLNVFFIERQV